MEMTKNQNRLYELGRSMADKSAAEVNEFFNQDTEYADLFLYYQWADTFYHAGLINRKPEWVKAIRYGEIPENGRSMNHASNMPENGVSCVKIIRNDEDLNYQSIYDFTQGAVQKIKKIMVEGWYIGGSGSDGEPLLIEAIKVKEL